MAIGYLVEFITVPLGALVLLYLGWPLDNAGVSAAIAGYLSWVMTEWWMHSYLFHKRFRKQHWVHHLRPLDPAGAPNTLVANGALAAVCGLAWAFAEQHIGGLFGSGFLLGYCTYVFTHYAVHRGLLSPESKIVKRHLLHHKGIEKNFNLLNPLGDLLMGTYLEPK